MSSDSMPSVVKNVGVSKFGSLQHEIDLDNIISISIESSLNTGASAEAVG